MNVPCNAADTREVEIAVLDQRVVRGQCIPEMRRVEIDGLLIQAVGLGREDEVAFGQAVHLVGPNRQLHFALGEVVL